MQNIAQTQALIIDMDGVLWEGNSPLAGLADFFRCLRQKQLPFVLATNNSSLTAQQYVAKLAGMGVTVAESEILTSSMAVAQYLCQQCDPRDTTIYIIGEEGLHQPLAKCGFNILQIPQLADYHPAKHRADYLVCGLDRSLTWEKMAIASLCLAGGAQFVASNADPSLPLELGAVPGNGATLAALQAASDFTPTIIGKPQPAMYHLAMQTLAAPKHLTLAVGDRLDTDILGAINTGIASALLLTGTSTQADLAKSPYTPTWVIADLPTLTRALQNC